MSHILVNDLGDGFITFPEFEKQLRAYEYALDHPAPPTPAPTCGHELQNLYAQQSASALAAYAARQNAMMQNAANPAASLGMLTAVRLPQSFMLARNIARLICTSHHRYLEKDEYGEMFCRGCRDDGQTTPLKELKLGGSL